MEGTQNDRVQGQRLHAIVEGRVQGVGFRYFVLDKANALGLTGWVRNHYSGEVEVCAEGSPHELGQLLSALRQGPRSAFVSDVKVRWSDASGEFERFIVAVSV